MFDYIDYRGGFLPGIKLSDEVIAEIACLRVVAIATIFGLKLLLTICVNDSD